VFPSPHWYNLLSLTVLYVLIHCRSNLYGISECCREAYKSKCCQFCQVLITAWSVFFVNVKLWFANEFVYPCLCVCVCLYVCVRVCVFVRVCLLATSRKNYWLVFLKILPVMYLCVQTNKDTIVRFSASGRRTVASRIWVYDWHQNRWPWMTLNGIMAIILPYFAVFCIL